MFYLTVDVNYHPASLGVTFGQNTESAVIISHLDWNDYYKSVATKVPHDARLEPTMWLAENPTPWGVELVLHPVVRL